MRSVHVSVRARAGAGAYLAVATSSCLASSCAAWGGLKGPRAVGEWTRGWVNEGWGYRVGARTCREAQIGAQIGA